MREDRHVVMSQPMEDLDGLFDFYAARQEEKCSGRNQRLMQCSEFRGAKLRFGRHEIFLENVRVLNHRALEWLEDHAAPFQIFRNYVALDQLIVRENHPRRVLVETAGILQDILTVIFRERPADFEGGQIKKIDIGK